MPRGLRVRVRQPVCLVAACVLALPATAQATGSGLHVDPQSPVAKAYALPLTAARSGSATAHHTVKLFGSGIKRAVGPAHTEISLPQRVQQAPTQINPRRAPARPRPAHTRRRRAHTRPAHARRRPVQHPITVTLPARGRPATVRRLHGNAIPASYRVLQPGSGSGLLWMVIAASVVLALGGAGALIRRR